MLLLDQEPGYRAAKSAYACSMAWGLHRLAVGAAAQHGVQHVVSDHRRPAAVVALAGGGVEPLKGDLADVLARPLADPTRRHLLDLLFERDGRTLSEL
jgi:hypothetical protein